MIALSVKTLEASRVRSAPQPMVSQRPAANARQPTPGSQRPAANARQPTHGGAAFGKMRGYLDLAFMGAAFLLLETKNVVQFALLFGATWFANSLVFAAVLVAVYLAVETANRVRLPRPLILYGLLIAALAWPGWCRRRRCSISRRSRASWQAARSPSLLSTSRTWSSPSGSPVWRPRARPSPPTCSVPWKVKYKETARGGLAVNVIECCRIIRRSNGSRRRAAPAAPPNGTGSGSAVVLAAPKEESVSLGGRGKGPLLR